MKIAKCKDCKKDGRVVNDVFETEAFVTCNTDGCWMGPDYPTKRKAISAWNRVMEVKE